MHPHQYMLFRIWAFFDLLIRQLAVFVLPSFQLEQQSRVVTNSDNLLNTTPECSGFLAFLLHWFFRIVLTSTTSTVSTSSSASPSASPSARTSILSSASGFGSLSSTDSSSIFYLRLFVSTASFLAFRIARRWREWRAFLLCLVLFSGEAFVMAERFSVGELGLLSEDITVRRGGRVWEDAGTGVWGCSWGKARGFLGWWSSPISMLCFTYWAWSWIRSLKILMIWTNGCSIVPTSFSFTMLKSFSTPSNSKFRAFAPTFRCKAMHSEKNVYATEPMWYHRAHSEPPEMASWST